MCGSCSRSPGIRAGATVRRALPLHLPARLLGPKVEPHGVRYTATHRIRPRQESSCPCDWSAVGHAASYGLGVCGVRFDARGHLLLSRPRASHVGGHVVLSATWNLHGHGGGGEEGGQGQVAFARGGFGTVDVGLLGGDRQLAVLPSAAEKRGPREGYTRVRNFG